MASTNDFKFDFSSIKSSAKNEDFTGLSEKQILEKYEELLLKREKEVKDISYQMGVVNEKYFDGLDKIKQLEKENEELENKIIKTSKLIENEINSKRIMNAKISELTKENNELRKEQGELQWILTFAGGSFGADGSILNYTDVFNRIRDEYNNAVNSYNATIDWYNSLSGEEQDESGKNSVEFAEKIFIDYVDVGGNFFAEFCGGKKSCRRTSRPEFNAQIGCQKFGYGRRSPVQ